MGQLPRSRASARRDQPDLVPAVPVADFVGAPVGTSDSSRRHDPTLRLGSDDRASRRPGRHEREPGPVRRPAELRHAVLGHPQDPWFAAVERTHHDRRRSVRFVRERAEEREPPAVGADARRRVADGACRQGDRRAGPSEVDQVKVGPVCLRAHEAPDDDGATATGKRVVLLEHDLAAQEPGRGDRRALTFGHVVQRTRPTGPPPRPSMRGEARRIRDALRCVAPGEQGD